MGVKILRAKMFQDKDSFNTHPLANPYSQRRQRGSENTVAWMSGLVMR